MSKRSQKLHSPENALAWSQIMVHGKTIEDRRDVSDAGIRRRLIVMSSVMILLFLSLMVRLFFMQVVEGSNLRSLANGNRLRETITYAPRGKIYDRNGNILADNSLSFQLSVTPYLIDKRSDGFGDDIQKISSITGIGPKTLKDSVLREGDEYVLPLLIKEDITHKEALLLETTLPKLEGFTLDQVPTRKYLSGFSLAHIIGYSGRVSESDIEADTTGRLLPTDYIGKSGIELSFDERLRGENGWVRYEVDALGRPVRIIDQKEPSAGEDIYLSIDLRLQKAMTNSIKTQMKKSKTSRASGVAVDPGNGQLLAMVSLPDYNHNLFTAGISQKSFDNLNNNPNQPLFNKALSGGFTTGSIIKPLVASAALQEGVVTPQTTIVDSGALTLPGGFTFLGWRAGGLGPMNVRSALAWSSNIYFYTVGGGFGQIEGLGEARLTKYYRMFGLGQATGIDLPNETAGRVPDEKWKMENKGEPWYQGDSYNIAIGQGDLLISPLQITMAEVAIANNGMLLVPQLERDSQAEIKREINVDKTNLQIVREGMRQVLTGGTTCECLFAGMPVKVAGKTGTAETNTPGGRRPHAWFTAYAPYEQNWSMPSILATVLIEEGEGGSQYAAPAIAETFKIYFKKP